jgi:hypothetical protein
MVPILFKLEAIEQLSSSSLLVPPSSAVPSSVLSSPGLR